MNPKKLPAKNSPSNLSIIGWRETIALPNLSISQVKAKIDTGARFSALHAFGVERFQRDRQNMIRFQIHPYQRDARYTVTRVMRLFI